MPQFTGKIVSALSSIHWCTKSFVRAVERARTNSYCDRAMQITGDLFFSSSFSSFTLTSAEKNTGKLHRRVPYHRAFRNCESPSVFLFIWLA